MKKNILNLYEGFFDDLDKLNKNQNDGFGEVNSNIYDKHDYILSPYKNPEFFKALCNFYKYEGIPYPLEENGFLQEDLNEITYINTDEFGHSFFENVTSLDELKYFNNLEKILGESFYKCTKLKSVIFPKNLKIIEYNAFEDCNSLKKISFSENIKIIGWGAFQGCSSLKEIIIPERFKYRISKICCFVDLSKVNITYI